MEKDAEPPPAAPPADLEARASRADSSRAPRRERGDPAAARKPVEEVQRVAIRFAGDSGDGMQLTGTKFTESTALAGNDLSTFPDFPAEIRAPAGTLAGVSGFQIHFASADIHTPADQPDVLVALNPAALRANVGELRRGGMIILNRDAFTQKAMARAGYDQDPLPKLHDRFQVVEIPITKLNREALRGLSLSQREMDRCKNFFALGLMYWLYHRPMESTERWLAARFRGDVLEANLRTLRAGHAFGETTELFPVSFTVPRAKIDAGVYRNITGNLALAWGIVAAAVQMKRPVFLGAYPITPASDVLHEVARHRNFGVKTFQAEDEIAAICSAIGASYAGAIGVTSSSGPGVALKTEAMGLAVVAELPLVVVDSQRAGPSTGMPTKTEQSDLLQAVYGRNGDTPIPVLAAHSPSSCFHLAIEAVRVATRYMTPVILLTDGYLANASEPWRLPDVDALAGFPVRFRTDPEGFQPYLRDPDTLSRPWAVPGTPGLEHRIGGIEKDYDTGNISYDPANHQRMTMVRRDKVAGIAKALAPQAVTYGEDSGALAVVGWGSTFGAIDQAVRRARAAGKAVSHIHLTWLNPFPRGLGDLLARFDKVLVPEMNTGQLVRMLRAEFLVPARGLNKVSGQPFKVAEVLAAIDAALEA
jgi:2-oxoglutarate ferredoxin oxidoreductase subunit alpha